MAAALVEQTYDALMQMIMDGNYKPGDRLPSEMILCNNLQVSRNTLRAALNKLNVLGFTETRQGGGTYMRAVDSSVYLNFFVPATLTSSMDLLEIMQFRKGIEVEAARLAAENATEEDVVLLRQLFEQCTEGRKNMRTFASRNTDFHFEIAKASHNMLYIKMMEIVSRMILPVMQDFLDAQGTDIDSTFYHGMKKLISLALAGGMVLSLAACGSSASTAASTVTESTSTAESTAESTASEGKQLKIAFFMYENSNTFTTYIRKGLENYGAENNVVVDSFDGKSDQSTQTDAITTTLAKGGYDLIVVNPVDSGAGETINNLCRQYDIPVIYADRAPDLVGGILDDYEQAYYVGLDWSDPGAVQAQMVYDAWTADSSKLDKNGDGVLQYVLLQGNVAQQNAIYRTAAINELFEGWAADGTMKTEQLDIQDGNWSSDKGKDVMDAWNVKFGDEIEAVLCNNDTMAMGAIESLKTAGAFDAGNGPIVYGINGIPDVWEMIEDGYMAGTVLTSPYREAKIIIDMAKNLTAGKEALDGTEYHYGEFGKDVRVDDVAITKDTLKTAQDDYAACM